jgi:hypothetical protein
MKDAKASPSVVIYKRTEEKYGKRSGHKLGQVHVESKEQD